MGRNEAGFTLLEVIIAIAIMVMALGTILAIEGGSINASTRAKQMNIVAMLAHNEMVKTELDLEGRSFDEVEEVTEGKFDPPYQDYRWRRKIKEMKFPNFASFNTGQNTQNDTGGTGSNDSANQISDTLSKLFSNYLSKALREVTVQIIWTKAGKEQSVSVSTYWVDLNHDFNLSQ